MSKKELIRVYFMQEEHYNQNDGNDKLDKYQDTVDLIYPYSNRSTQIQKLLSTLSLSSASAVNV